jgi:hypothetical protein
LPTVAAADDTEVAAFSTGAAHALDASNRNDAKNVSMVMCERPSVKNLVGETATLILVPAAVSNVYFCPLKIAISQIDWIASRVDAWADVY